MNNEFHEKLQLYKEGKLSPSEMAEIESEIDKFAAMIDYLNGDDKAFLEELKEQIPVDNGEENRPAKILKRKVNLRIIVLTAISAFSVLILTIFLFFSIGKITTSLFSFDYKESFVKSAIIGQLVEMFHPQYEIADSSMSKSPFAQQNIDVSLKSTVGNTLIDRTKINVRYSFGKPIKTESSVSIPLLQIEDLNLLNSHGSNSIWGFKILEKAPQGTKAKIFVEFNKPLTPEQLKEHFLNQISIVDTAPLEITPLTTLGSRIVLANPSFYQFTPVFPFGNNKKNNKKNAKQLDDNNLKQTLFENMDNQAQKESFIGNLNLIKSNKRLLQIMYSDEIFDKINIDDIIKQVENNGVQYVGVYISADSKELLKLKDNPLIKSVIVENIVVW